MDETFRRCAHKIHNVHFVDIIHLLFFHNEFQ